MNPGFDFKGILESLLAGKVLLNVLLVLNVELSFGGLECLRARNPNALLTQQCVERLLLTLALLVAIVLAPFFRLAQ